MKITDMKCAIIGGSPVVRITTDEGIDGRGQGETEKPYLKPMVMCSRDGLVGKDRRDVGGGMGVMGEGWGGGQGRLVFGRAGGVGEAFGEREADLDVVRGVLGDALAGR